MYVGIDLGTSNSAIVGSDGTDLRIFKAEDGRDVLPSVIHYDRRGHMTVGTRAYAQAELAPTNVAQGFKRLMGTSSEINLPGADKKLTPEVASAEIIRTLLRQLEAEVGKTEISGAIITIPAAFNQMQSEATIKAAELAGLERVGLLQEPIAAAMAALEGATRRDGRFLIYDLGGGTFDVALVEAAGGSVNVLAHEGINMLGGRDFDRAIVDSIVRVWLLDHFDLPASASVEPEYRRLFAMARFRAEQAKIELSTRQEAPIYLSDEDTRAEDQQGAPIYVDCTLTRTQLDDLIVERIDDSIALCRKVLSDNGLSHEDIDRIVLIGGPSKMPLVRERVGTQLGIAVDIKIDPMTAVARGAAIFAESRDWSQSRGQRKSSRASAKISGDIEVLLQFTSRVSDQQATLRLKATLPSGGYRFRVVGPRGFDSGFKAFEGQAQIALPLVNMGENEFQVQMLGADGRDACPPQQVVITRTQSSATAIPATQSISVKIAHGPIAERRNILVPLVKKGTPLPAQGSNSFKLREAVTGDDGSHFDIELYNHVEGVDDPLLNLPIGMFRLRGADILGPGESLPGGSAVTMNWSMDDNGLITCEVELPELGLSLNQKNFYVPEGGHRNFEGNEGAELAQAQLGSAANALDETKEALQHKNTSEIASLERRLGRMQELLANSNEAEARRTATEEALYIQQELARLRDAPGNRKAVILRDLQAFEDAASEMIETLDADTVERIQQLGDSARDAVAREDWTKARQIFEQMETLFYRALYQEPGFVMGMFNDLSNERYAAVDKDLHDRLIEQGVCAIEANDVDGLRNVIRLILNNRMPNDGGSKKVAMLASLIQ